MSDLILGIGDLGISDQPDKIIKTYALGSCVAIVMYDLVTRTAGMAHIALPDSSTDREKSFKKPGYFADTAIPKLIETIKSKNPGLIYRKLVVKLVGGASVMDSNNFFNIGKRNITACREIIQSKGLFIQKEDVGKNISRTVSIDSATGIVLIFNPEKGVWQI